MGVFFVFFFYILASYLPSPSCHEYEFVYISAKGEVCSRSSKFTFCAPKPLEDLVTLEESHGEEEGTDMLMVVPRAELLQVSRTQKRLVKVVKEEAVLVFVWIRLSYLFLPAAVSLFKDSTARMPARARRAAAGSRGSQQAEGERENGVQESKGGMGQTTQRAREWDQQATEGAASQFQTDTGHGEEAGGNVPITIENPHKAKKKILNMSIRRSRTWLNYWLRKRVHYWKQMRKAEFESRSWRRTSKPWLRGQWTERQRWKGRKVSPSSLSSVFEYVGVEMLISLQDEGESKESRSPEEGGGEWKECSASN